MVQKHIIISMIAPVAIAGILIMAILANQAYSSSGSLTSVKCKITKHGHTKCKTKTTQEASTTGNGATSQQSSNTGNAAQEASTTGNGATSQQSSNTGNAAQEASTTGNGATSQQSSNTGNAAQVKICRESFAICNSGKGKMENVMVHNPPPLSGTGYVPVKCGSSGYIWYPKQLGGGFRHCAPGSIVNAPPGSSSTHPLARSSNSGNTAQESSNSGNGATNTATIQLKCTTGYIWLPTGGFRHCALGAMVNAPQGSSNTHPGLKTES
jgi:hypothetical protein